MDTFILLIIVGAAVLFGLVELRKKLNNTNEKLNEINEKLEDYIDKTPDDLMKLKKWWLGDVIENQHYILSEIAQLRKKAGLLTDTEKEIQKLEEKLNIKDPEMDS